MNQDSTDSDDDIVITPGGPMPRSATHRVPAGGEVRQEADGTYTVVGPSAEHATQRRKAMPNNLVLTPGGYRDAALVHHVATDTVIDASQGRLRPGGESRACLRQRLDHLRLVDEQHRHPRVAVRNHLDGPDGTLDIQWSD